MGNVDRAARLIDEVRAAGVGEFCICAGSRNAPLLAVLGGSDARLFSFVDERSAAFFALGRFKQHGQPVAVVTTSGTAVAELLPAAIEAYYSGIPLVLISADRPSRFRGTGAPQSIEQEGIFGVYAETSMEAWTRTRPLHLNIEFDEPLMDEAVPGYRLPVAAEGEVVAGCRLPVAGESRVEGTASRVAEGVASSELRVARVDPSAATALATRNAQPATSSSTAVATGNRQPATGPATALATRYGQLATSSRTAMATGNRQPATGSATTRRPLVIIGALREHHRQRVKAFAIALGAPVYAEALSGLREDPDLPHILSGERMITRGAFDSVIRIGGVPTLRFWRDLENLGLPVTHYSDLPFPGLTRGDVHRIEALPGLGGERDMEFHARDREQAALFTRILDEEPESELAMLRALSRQLPHGARVYLGNSLPIREWDLAASREPRGFVYEANRGANGIDGQLSTFFGWAAPDAHNVCIVGDLTAIYDLGAPWIARQLDAPTRMVIVNNGGGRIFGRVASLRTLDTALRERIIENVHDVRFDHWARMWNLDMTELRPDPAASQRAWQKYDQLWA